MLRRTDSQLPAQDREILKVASKPFVPSHNGLSVDVIFDLGASHATRGGPGRNWRATTYAITNRPRRRTLVGYGCGMNREFHVLGLNYGVGDGSA
jgi:hypothetical protein